jgi:hypothetical protein
MDEVDPYLEDAADVVARLNGAQPVEEQGTLARLINDPALGDDILDVTEGARAATSSFGRIKTNVRLRAEYGLWNRLARVIVGAEVAGRADSFYLFEAEKGQRGDVPEATLTDSPGDDRFVRTAVIRDELRFTAQWGRRVGWARFRFGLKESEVGFGADAVLLGGRLKLSGDLFGASSDTVPQLEVVAALQVVESIFIHAGVDDVLHGRGALPIVAGDDDVPQQLRELRHGRDVFGGISFQFDDEDLDELLLLYGAVIFAAL